MVFNSLSFLYLLLPLTALLYFLLPGLRWRNGVLLLASLVFYAWAEPKLLLLLLAAALVAWLGGLAIPSRWGKAAYPLSLCLLLANLLFFKYLPPLSGALGTLLRPDSPLRRLALPAGISFYTFQLLSYLADVHREKLPPEKNFLRLLLFTCLFPQLIAGPILRYGDLAPQFTERRTSAEDAAAGLRRFTVGLAKKVLLAGGAAELSDLIYGGDPAVFGSAMYWLAAVFYALELYFDFSGYSDMAIGLGRLFGFRIPENFDFPYTALSVTDFWRRWHISLSSWFRDYIYIPLGGNRVGRGRWVRNILIVWLLTGLWHGAQLNFLLWGLYYGLLLLVEKLWLGKPMEKLPKALRWLITAFIVVLGWVLFHLTDPAQLLSALRQMFAFAPTQWAEAVARSTDILYAPVYLPLCLVCMFPLGRLLPAKPGPGCTAVKNVLCFLLLLICTGFILGGSYNPFIYFQF